MKNKEKRFIVIYNKDITHEDGIEHGLLIYETDCPIGKLPIRDEKRNIFEGKWLDKDKVGNCDFEEYVELLGYKCKNVGLDIYINTGY
jgi:hypothetical protein